MCKRLHRISVRLNPGFAIVSEFLFPEYAFKYNAHVVTILHDSVGDM